MTQQAPTTPSHAALLCEELETTGSLSAADTALLLAAVTHYGLDHNAAAADWRRSFQTHADADALRAHFTGRKARKKHDQSEPHSTAPSQRGGLTGRPMHTLKRKDLPQ